MFQAIEHLSSGWNALLVLLYLLAASTIPHIKTPHYWKACIISGLLVLGFSVSTYALWGYSLYRQKQIDFEMLLIYFPYAFLPLLHGVVLSALVGLPFWLYRARHSSGTVSPG